MTDPGPMNMYTMEEVKEILTQFVNAAAQNNRSGGDGGTGGTGGGSGGAGAGGASSANLGKDKKTPMKKKKPENKEFERLKKKIAQDKAKLAQVCKELKVKKLAEALERAETKKKKEEERIRALKEKLNESTGQKTMD